MPKLNREKSPAQQVQDEIEQFDDSQVPDIVKRQPINWDKIVSTHSTLLDLAISGGRLEEGGIPCCILCEVHGPAGSGKTSVLSEIGADAQEQDGDIICLDPEARMDEEYARIYNIQLSKKNYYRPEKVGEIFSLVKDWRENNESKGPMVALTDSLAALTTDLELETGDKMGMRRAKEFSQGFRVNARLISTMLWVCSNQERDSDNGIVTPGGKAIPYYSSLRIRMKQRAKIEIEKKLDSGTKVSKVIGIISDCYIGKSTVDDPYRTAPVYIVFGLGIDDVRANLQYIKDMKKDKTYIFKGKSFLGMEQAIRHVEAVGGAKELRKNTIQLWHEIEELFQENKKREKSKWR